MRFGAFWPVVAVCAILLAGCAPEAPSGSQANSPADRPVQPKRLVLGSAEPSPFLIEQLDSSADVVEELVSAGLIRFAPTGEPAPLLAEAVPSLDNNLWKVSPDGRMETTWKLRDGVKWHDGTPLTTDDLLFAVRVGQDPALPNFGHETYRNLDRVRAVDARTVVAEWKQPYIQADNMFSWRVALPLPKHLLEDTYLNNKEGFTQHRYWTQEFVHTGPFIVREFLPAERLRIEANPDFVFGRPKVDEVEVRFIPDANTLVTNVLAGEIHLTIGSDVSLDQAFQVADRWPEGRLETFPLQSVKVGEPQLVNPDPAALLDVRFRRALVHAFDRQELNKLLNREVTPPPANFYTPVGAPVFPELKPSIVEYPYDPRRAAQLIEEVGYTRVGGTYRDATGKELSVEFRASQVSADAQATLFIVDSWKRVGVNGIPDIRSGRDDPEETAMRPAFKMSSSTLTMAQPTQLTRLRTVDIPTAENRFRGRNSMRYSNPELDGLIGRFLTTVPHQERVELLRQIAHHVTDNAVVMATYHLVFPALINNRVKNVTPRTDRAQTWDSHKWDIE